jgi:hypothetical protein
LHFVYRPPSPEAKRNTRSASGEVRGNTQRVQVKEKGVIILIHTFFSITNHKKNKFDVYQSNPVDSGLGLL